MTTATHEAKLNLWEAFGQVCAIVALIVFNCIAYAFVVVTLWRWFVVPLGVAPITIPVAIGLDALYHAINPPAENKENEKKDPGELVVRGLKRTIAMCTLLLFLGWTAHHFA